MEDHQALSFDALLAPVGAERFFAEYHGRKPLHLKGAADKFEHVMTWARLNELLGMTTVWTAQSLQLVLDKEPIPPAAYAAPGVGRDTGGQVLRPDPEKVKGHLRRGATLVANDIDNLNPGLRALSRAMEAALGGKVQANLYLSSRRRQGFAAHFDTHDVFAVHVEGEKTWHVYEGRAEWPINHPMFKTLGREHHERAKGGLLFEAHMTPGDLLYLPRGQYHDAIAHDGGTIHVAMGVTYPIGLDVMSLLYERTIAEALFRADLPRHGDGPEAEAALRERLQAMGRRLTEILAHPDTAATVRAMQRAFRFPREGYDLPDVLEDGDGGAFRVRAQGVRLVQHAGRYGLLREGGRAAVEVPAEVSELVAWVLERPRFSRRELAGAFPDRRPAQLDKLLRDLGAMRLTEPA